MRGVQPESAVNGASASRIPGNASATRRVVDPVADLQPDPRRFAGVQFEHLAHRDRPSR